MSKPAQCHARPMDKANALVIDIAGELNLASRHGFRRAFTQGGNRYRRYIINLKQCPGMDSWGLGLLLLLRDYSGLEREGLRLINCPAPLKQLLYYSHLDHDFTIE